MPWLEHSKSIIRGHQSTLASTLAGRLIESIDASQSLTRDVPAAGFADSYSKRLVQAIKRYAVLHQLASSRQLLVSKLKGIGLTLLPASEWLENGSLQLRYPLPLRAKAMQAAWEKNRPDLAEANESITSFQIPEVVIRDSPIPFVERPFGVNLIGHAFNIFGIGEDSRAIAAALKASDIPFCVIDHPARNGSATTDRRLEDKTLPAGELGPYAFNLVCMAAPIHARWFCEEGLAQQLNRYTIVSWPWELERWPQGWNACLYLADEAWPYSRIIQTALQPFTDPSHGSMAINLTRMPPPAEIKGADDHLNPLMRRNTRERFGLPKDRVLFIFSFDLNSSFARKNPEAMLKAFASAFPEDDPLGDHVGLVIKTLAPGWPHPAWQDLKARAAADYRLYIIEASLDRPDLLALYGCCDSFVSLHRSEGLGRGHAEALQLGLDVIVTDYSSTADFCTGPLAHPIRYTLIPVQEGEYYNQQNQLWAEPNLRHAAQLMREVAMKRLKNPNSNPALAASYRHRFSSAEVGSYYRRRLEVLWQQREKLMPHLKAWGLQ